MGQAVSSADPWLRRELLRKRSGEEQHTCTRTSGQFSAASEREQRRECAGVHAISYSYMYMNLVTAVSAHDIQTSCSTQRCCQH